MIYTIGMNYPENIQLKKAVGGSVFKTYEDAKERLMIQKHPEHWKIFGVEAEWDDCEIVEGQSFRNLKKAARIVRIEN